MSEFDEFSLLGENASEVGRTGPLPAVTRRSVPLVDGRTLSVLVWGSSPPEVVLLHGGAQNAHTWDSVVLALDLPLVAIDLPGHGRSSWRDDGAYDPASMADDVAMAVTELAPQAAAVVGMSLGGLTAIALAARHPSLVRRLLLVDITPGVDREKAAAIVNFVSGPTSFPSFDALLERTVTHNPTRTEASLRRGLLHNAEELPDGSWAWRHHLGRGGLESPDPARYHSLWDDLGSVAVPVTLARGGDSPVVDDADVAELRRRLPAADIVVVPGAGHSIQGDKPVELAELIRRFVSQA